MSPASTAAQSAVPCIGIDLKDLSPEARFAAWAAAVPQYKLSLPKFSDIGKFQIRSMSWLLGDVIVSRTVLPAVCIERTAERIKQDGIDTINFMVAAQGGWRADIGSGTIAVEQGQISAYDLSRPFSSVGQAGEFISIVISRSTLDEAIQTDVDIHGHIFDDAAGRLFADHALALVRHLPLARQKDIVALRSGLLALMSNAALSVPVKDDAAVSVRSTRHRVRRHIERHLNDPGLNPNLIAKTLGIPRANLYRAFKALGGIAKYIQRRRLEAIRALLMNPEERRPIGELAHSFGFSNLSHFTTAFRRTFDQAPRDLRSTKQWPTENVSSSDLADAPQRFRKWKRTVQQT